MNLNIPALDLAIEEEGKWFTYRGAIRLKVARMDNDAYVGGASEMHKLIDEKSGKVSADEKKVFMLTLYSRYILMDWEGVVDNATDEPVAYTPEAGLAVFSEAKYKDLFSFVMTRSMSIAEYWEEKTAEMGEP